MEQIVEVDTIRAEPTHNQIITYPPTKHRQQETITIDWGYLPCKMLTPSEINAQEVDALLKLLTTLLEMEKNI